jgi:hypothetical protein
MVRRGLSSIDKARFSADTKLPGFSSPTSYLLNVELERTNCNPYQDGTFLNYIRLSISGISAPSRSAEAYLPGMAPYALTPTTERGELFDGPQITPQNEFSFDNTTSAPPVRETSEDQNGSVVNDRNGHNEYQNNSNTDNSTGTGRLFDGNKAPLPDVTYESAYTDGYTEGYTSGYKKSHIELQHQPIAIIGMSCRLPGSVSTPDEFWELLARSRTGFSPIPATRFSTDRFFHPNPGKSGTTNARGGNFLTHDLAAFDAPFFGLTQQEAISLDPQQRLLLECTFEALETAGIPRHDVVGTAVGVFVGGTFSEYEADSFRDPDTIPMHQATGKRVYGFSLVRIQN